MIRCRYFLLAGSLLCLLLAGCSGRDANEFLATDKYEFKSRKAGEEEQAAFKKTATNFALRSADFILKEENGVVGSMALFQYGLVLLNGAEGQTYAQAAKFLGTEEPDSFPYDYAFCDWVRRSGNGKPFNVRGSLWMLWPIPLQESFRKDMAEHFRYDVQKIGSVGISANRYLDEWWQKETGLSAKAPVPLDKSIIMVGLSSMTCQLAAWHPAPGTNQLHFGEFSGSKGAQQALFWEAKDAIKIETPQFVGYKLATSSGINTYFLQGKEKLLIPTAAQWLEILNAPGLKTSVWIPEFRLESQLEISPLLTKMGSGDILQPPMEMPNLSVEISGDFNLGPSVLYSSIGVDRFGLTSNPTLETLGASQQPIPGREILNRPFTIIVADSQRSIPTMLGRISHF